MLSVLVLVGANGFFVASEFSLVAVRRSRVAELVASGRLNAKALQRAVDNLDASLAATQLGITLSSLALGWIGEPALSHLIEPLLAGRAGSFATTGSHAIAVIALCGPGDIVPMITPTSRARGRCSAAVPDDDALAAKKKSNSRDQRFIVRLLRSRHCDYSINDAAEAGVSNAAV